MGSMAMQCYHAEHYPRLAGELVCGLREQVQGRVGHVQPAHTHTYTHITLETIAMKGQAITAAQHSTVPYPTLPYLT